MRILVYGAGVIGSLLAAKLQDSGNDVTVLARGKRLQDIKDFGIVLRDPSGRVTTTEVRLTDNLIPDDVYDLVIVPVQRTHLPEILPILTENKSPNILVMVNNCLGYTELVETLGDRVLVGFPGAGGGRHGHIVEYILAPSILQANTFGEIDGTVTPRLRSIVRAFRAAGLTAVICRNMDAWQKTHVAWVSPIANAIYRTGDLVNLANSPDDLRLLIRAVRQGFRVLRVHEIPILPSKHAVWKLVPTPVLVIALRILFSTKFAEEIIARHANAAKEEMDVLSNDFATLIQQADVDTPAIDCLRD